jgi:hypothetical protein
MLVLPGAAFSTLGLLIGSLAGLTVSPIVVALISALFAFVGGSAVAFVGTLNRDQLKLASLAVLCLSAFMLIGLIGGMIVKINGILIFDPDQRAAVKQELVKSGDFGLRASHETLMKDLQASVITGAMKLEDACNTAVEAKTEQHK